MRSEISSPAFLISARNIEDVTPLLCTSSTPGITELDLVGVFDASEELDVVNGHTILRLERRCSLENAEVDNQDTTILTSGDNPSVIRLSQH